MVKVEILRQKGCRFLYIDDYLWMWELPAEVEIQRKLAAQAYGNVLVAGYGLGILQKFLIDNPNVKSVLTIEKVPEVVDVCMDDCGKVYGEVLFGDFLLWTALTDSDIRIYDCVIGDIWPEIAPEGLEIYKRFEAKAQQLIKPGGKILAWGQDYFEFLNRKEQ